MRTEIEQKTEQETKTNIMKSWKQNSASNCTTNRTVRYKLNAIAGAIARSNFVCIHHHTYQRTRRALRWYQNCKQPNRLIRLYLLQMLHKISFYRLAIDKPLVFRWNKMEIRPIYYNLIVLSNMWPNSGWVYFCRRYPFYKRERCANKLLYHNLCIQQPFHGRKSKHIRQYRRSQQSLVL